MQLLDWSDTVTVTVAADQFNFTVANQDTTDFSSDFSCVLTTDYQKLTINFSGYANGQLQLPPLVGLALGEIGVGNGNSDQVVDLSYQAAVVVDEASGFSLSGSFSFAGDSFAYSLPQIDSIDIDKWSHLPALLLQQIGNNAETIFSRALVAAGKMLVAFGDVVWDTIQAKFDETVGAAYDDVKHGVETFCGIHKSKNTKTNVPWLQDHAIVSAYGADQSLQDSTDPNYSDQAVYLVRKLQRIYIPDPATLAVVQKQFDSLLWGTQYQYSNPDGLSFSPDYVITIPCAATEWPSVEDGTIYWEYSGGNETNLFLAMTCYTDDGPTPVPTQYAIQNQSGAAYIQATNASPNPPRLLKLPCADTDIGTIKGSPLKTPCLIIQDKPAPYEIDVFVDGICRLVPDETTLGILDKNKVGSTQFKMPQIGTDSNNNAIYSCDLIPKGPALLALTPGMLVMSQDMTKGEAQYLVGKDNKLHQFPDVTAVTNWGYDNKTHYTLDDQNLNLLAIGDKLTEKPSS